MLLDSTTGQYSCLISSISFEMMLVPQRGMATLAEATDAELKGLAERRVSLRGLTGCWAKFRLYSLGTPSPKRMAASRSAWCVLNLRAYSALLARPLCKSLAGIETAADWF